jgi:hypothetical protein
MNFVIVIAVKDFLSERKKKKKVIHMRVSRIILSLDFHLFDKNKI